MDKKSIYDDLKKQILTQQLEPGAGWLNERPVKTIILYGGPCPNQSHQPDPGG